MQQVKWIAVAIAMLLLVSCSSNAGLEDDFWGDIDAIPYQKSEDGRIGMFSVQDGKPIFEEEFGSDCKLSKSHNGIFTVEKNGRVSIYKTGKKPKLLCNETFASVGVATSGVIPAVQMDSRITLISTSTGKPVAELQKYKDEEITAVLPKFMSGVTSYASSSGYYGLVSVKGEILTSPRYDGLFIPYSNYYLARDLDKNQYDVLDKRGKVLFSIKADFDRGDLIVGPSSFIVKNKVYDPKGNVIGQIADRYKPERIFTNGTILVSDAEAHASADSYSFLSDATYGVLDKTGQQEEIRLDYPRLVLGHSNNHYIYLEHSVETDLDGEEVDQCTWVFLDAKTKEKVYEISVTDEEGSAKYKEVAPLKNGSTLVPVDGEYVLYDAKGNLDPSITYKNFPIYEPYGQIRSSYVPYKKIIKTALDPILTPQGEFYNLAKAPISKLPYPSDDSAESTFSEVDELELYIKPFKYAPRQGRLLSHYLAKTRKGVLTETPTSEALIVGFAIDFSMRESIKAVTKEKFNEKIFKAIKEYLKNQGWEEMPPFDENTTWYTNRKGSKWETILLNVNEEMQNLSVVIFTSASSDTLESEPVEE